MALDPTNAIEVRGLVKRYGAITAVNGLDLTVRRGEFLGVLGPNGAGKSTTIRILTTLMPATEGEVVIAGLPVPRENARVRPLLGLTPQEIALYGLLSARQNLRFFASLYHLRGAALERRVGELLEQVGLTDRADEPVQTYSGGMQRRVNIAAALIHDPEIVFLDEPTVGLDPVSRSAIWDILIDLKARGKTILLTTHYMEEAEALSDRVAVIDHGRLIAVGTAAELIRATGVQSVVQLTVAGDAAACVKPLQCLEGVREVRVSDGALQVTTASGSRQLPQMLETLFSGGVVVRSAQVVEPNLGAVFVHYTGRQLRD